MVAAVTVMRVVGLFLHLFDQRLLGGKNKTCELHKSELLPFLYETKQTASCSTSVTILIFIHELT